LGIAYLHQGAYDEAIQEFQRATNLSNGGTDYIAQLGQAYAKSGKKGETFKILRRLKELSTRVYVSPYYMALIYTALGDHDQVFKWLDRACDERSSFLFFLKVEPAFDNVRSDPRFQDLVRRVKLPP